MAKANTYTKLKDGSWGVRAEGTVKAGAVLTVTKKDGSTKTETVKVALWSGNGITLCAIVPTKSDSGGSRINATNGERKGVCANCGETCNPKYRRCLDCVDGGSRANGGMSYYDRNGNFILGDDD